MFAAILNHIVIRSYENSNLKTDNFTIFHKDIFSKWLSKCTKVPKWFNFFEEVKDTLFYHLVT